MKMLIGGKKVDSSNKKTIQVVNPATGALVDSIPAATEQDVLECIEHAQKGKRIWRWTPLHERNRMLRAYADIIDASRKELSELLCIESGKPIVQCEGEVDATAALLRSYVAKVAHLYTDVLPETEAGQDENIIFTKREPLGVVVMIIPFNYPLGLYMHKAAPALAMGNAVIVKPASITPLACMRIVELAVEAGIPGDVVQSVSGSGTLVGKWLCQSAKVNAVGLTGSTDVGVDVLHSAAQNILHAEMELGGNDPLIICEDANLDRAVEEAIIGRLPHGGQICSGSKRFFAHKAIKERFTGKLVDRLKGVKIGDPKERDIDLGCLAGKANALEVESQIQLTVKQGAKCVYGGKYLHDAFIEPAVLTDVTMDMDIALNMEVFGPVFPIIEFEDINDAIAMANASHYGLQGGIITENVSLGLYVAERLECGCAVVNGTGNYRHFDQAFGGYKMSGIGREGCSETLHLMSQTKTYVLKNILEKSRWHGGGNDKAYGQ